MYIPGPSFPDLLLWEKEIQIFNLSSEVNISDHTLKLIILTKRNTKV